MIIREAGLALAFLALSPAIAAAQLPVQESVRLGRPARAVSIRVAAGEQGATVTASAGGRRASETLPVQAAEATIERVEVAAGEHVAVVRTRADDESAAALVAMIDGRPEVIWTGRTDLHGDPGERTADALSVEDRTGDGFADVVVGTHREGASLCSQTATLLAPQAFDPAQGELRPVMLRRVPEGGEEVAVIASRESPGPSGPPLLDALRFRGASSTAGRGASFAPPHALGDGDPATFWAEGRGGPGTGEYVVARFGARFPIRAIAITAATGEAGEALGRPRRFWLIGDQGPRVRVTMPDDAGLHPGERYWITLPTPAEWRCVALVLDEAYPPAGVRDAAVHTGLAEIEAYTELDFGGGVEQLVSVLIEGADGGDEATRLLSGLGAPAVRGLRAAWERLDETGRRRAVRVFAANAHDGAEGAVEALALAARDAAAPVREPALEALGELGAPAAAALAALVLEPAPIGDAALAPLRRLPPAEVVPALLAALAAPGGSARPGVRDGLALALAEEDEAARGAFEAWVLSEPPVDQLASAALGLSGHAATRPLAARLVGIAAPRATEFEDRYRLVRAAATLENEPEIDAWLAMLAEDAEAWMLRAGALAALDGRDSERRVEAARGALEDDYPRVRVAAIEVLDRADVDDGALGRLARDSTWPMVREAAVAALWDRTSERDTVRSATRDRSTRVRVAALEALTRARDRAAWPLVRAKLADDNEWPQVTVAGLRYVQALCLEEASEVLVDVIRRGVGPSPWPPDVEVAGLAVNIALTLGGPGADEALALEARPDAPASIRAAVLRHRADPRRCEPAE